VRVDRVLGALIVAARFCMVSLHRRPSEVEDLLMPGYWEVGLTNGKNIDSVVGTLVERSSGYLMLVKINDATSTSAIEGFSAGSNGMPLAARKSIIYEQSKEMARQAELTQAGIANCLADPHSQ